jgi:hypothetical protein
MTTPVSGFSAHPEPACPAPSGAEGRARRLYGHELRDAIVYLLSTIPQVHRINYLEYWNDQTFIIFLDPADEATKQNVESNLKTYLDGPGAARSAGVRWYLKHITDPVPSSATFWHR